MTCGKDDCTFASCEMQARLGWERGYHHGDITIEHINKKLVYYLYAHGKDGLPSRYEIDREAAHEHWHNVLPRPLPPLGESLNFGSAMSPPRPPPSSPSVGIR